MNVCNKYVPGQVWICSGEDDQSKWKEGVIAKTRPVVIINVNAPGKNLVVIPMTSSERSASTSRNHYFRIGKYNSWAILNSPKTVSFEDMLEYKYTLDKTVFEKILEGMKSVLILTNEELYEVPKQNQSKKHHQKNESSDRKRLITSLKREYTQKPMRVLMEKYGMSKAEIYQIVSAV